MDKVASRTRTVSFEVRHRDPVSIIDLRGSITIGHGDRVLRDAVQALQDEGHANILVNLAGVPYMDSVGLAELAACIRRVAERRGTIKLLNPTRKLAELLRVTRLTDALEVFEDESEAISSF